MNTFRYYILLLLCCISIYAHAKDDSFVLHDKCINELYLPAKNLFNGTKIAAIRDSRGIVLRFKLGKTSDEYNNLTEETVFSINKIKYFLAKIKNPAIIEVHAQKDSKTELSGMRNWEISTVIANNIEEEICSDDEISKNRIHSVGYGEFLPQNNTSNNGGNLSNRVDIIILCNISGE